MGTQHVGEFATKWLNIYGENVYANYLRPFTGLRILCATSFEPTVSGTYSLGTDSDRWQYVYTETANISVSLFTPSMRAYNPLLDLLCESNFVPDADSTYDLGTEQ